MYIQNAKKTDYPNNTTKLAIPCPFCGKTTEVTVDTQAFLAGLSRYKDGELAQKAWPSFSPDIRDLFISGICSKCWDNM